MTSQVHYDTADNIFKWNKEGFPRDKPIRCDGKGFCCEGRRCDSLQYQDDLSLALKTALVCSSILFLAGSTKSFQINFIKIIPLFLLTAIT